MHCPCARSIYATDQETDKATIDVEAQDDGIMGKILSQSGAQKIPVGQVIAVLAEEGDDLSALEIPSDISPPQDDTPSSSSSSYSDTKGSSSQKELASTPRNDKPEESPSTQRESSSPKSGEPSRDRQNAPQAGIKTEEKAEKIQKGGVPVDVGAHKGNVEAGASGRPLFPSVMRL
jgi:pyruvate/2-oxoglutarate dehydrogenase complex dihydrolipoamide acyltransferase (E2) component